MRVAACMRNQRSSAQSGVSVRRYNIWVGDMIQMYVARGLLQTKSPRREERRRKRLRSCYEPLRKRCRPMHAPRRERSSAEACLREKKKSMPVGERCDENGAKAKKKRPRNVMQDAVPHHRVGGPRHSVGVAKSSASLRRRQRLRTNSNDYK